MLGLKESLCTPGPSATSRMLLRHHPATPTEVTSARLGQMWGNASGQQGFSGRAAVGGKREMEKRKLKDTGTYNGNSVPPCAYRCGKFVVHIQP